MSSRRKIYLFLGIIVSIFTMVLPVIGVSAQVGPDETGAPVCESCNGLGTSGGGPEGGVTEGLTSSLYNANIKGGYVASGVGMRNRGWGTILIKDIPASSTITKAYLFWSIISPSGVTTPPASYATGKINGTAITGTLVGSADQPCWGGGKIFGYRADVTAKVTGNNLYHLQDFASGYKWGDIDPWVSVTTYPACEGASLVIIYSKSAYPLTNIQIKQGVITLISTSSTTTFSGFPASSLPVAKTTYVVADGQSNGTESVKFNNIEMPTNFCDGMDRQNGINFKYRNLQDTNTAIVTVNPGATSVDATITSTGDCLTWLAQVFSVYDGNLDTDGDALKDSWEVYGVGGINLPAKGANPYHKDIFVEVDWMAKSPTETQSHKPDPSVVTRAVSTFANAPYANNPDGKAGINIHVDISNEVPHDDNLQPVWDEFDVIKAANFPAARQDIYHYCLFAHMFEGGTWSGISRGIPASDFIVSLGGWSTNPGTPDQQTGTFIHELGHNLGLRHGGNDDKNYKPNYLSIMNYFFQMSGVYRSGSWGHYDYQRIAPYTLNEASLLEANGIGDVSAGYGTQWYDPSGTVRTTTVYKPIDWNWSGAINASAVSVDLNHDGSKTTLGSQNNWQNIIYNGGSIGGAAFAAAQITKPEDMPEELTYEEYIKISQP